MLTIERFQFSPLGTRHVLREVAPCPEHRNPFQLSWINKSVLKYADWSDSKTLPAVVGVIEPALCRNGVEYSIRISISLCDSLPRARRFILSMMVPAASLFQDRCTLLMSPLRLSSMGDGGSFWRRPLSNGQFEGGGADLARSAALLGAPPFPAGQQHHRM